jgi:hypothetical protein
MSLCIGFPARAGRLIALICISCVSFQLLLIYDVQSVVLPASAACVQVLSCGAELSRGLDGEVGGHLDHVGRCR